MSSALKSTEPLWDLVSSLASKWTPTEYQPALRKASVWSVYSPMHSSQSVVAAISTYLILIFGIQQVMKPFKPLKFRQLFMLHNVLLSAGSGLVLALMVEELVPIVWRDGFFAGICAYSSWTPKLELLYIINYLFKYWELADTIFLVFKKKPLQFLHVFHHTATALLCWTQLNGRTAVSWVPITLNLTVHVIMYYYYFITTLKPGIKIWWKKYLTSLQISQFLIDLFVIYFATYSYFASTYFPNLPTVGSCAGTESAAIFGCALLTSYLFLFIAFYQRTYSKDKAAKAAIKAAKQTVSGSGPSPSAPLPNGIKK